MTMAYPSGYATYPNSVTDHIEIKTMFKSRTISSEPTFKFWQKLSRDSNERRLREQLFQFSKKGNNTIIKIKNEGMILNPEIDFLQARLLNDEKKIIVETSNFIKWLYIGLIAFTFLFAILQLKNSFIISIIVLILFGLIFLYNYKKINIAISKFENILENNARFG